MAVFTTVTEQELSLWLNEFDVGSLVAMQPILAGVDNTNFFVTTTDSAANSSQGDFVLTLFEHLSPEQLQYNLGLMAHLAKVGLPTPLPISNRQGHYLGQLNGKPAALVTRLPGTSVDKPSVTLCEKVGGMLGNIHRAGQSFPAQANNRRGAAWRQHALISVRNFLPEDSLMLIEHEVELQAQYNTGNLPCGNIHGDLFTDNVLVTDDRISGVIDFYFACTDILLYDLAIAANDWCSGPDFRLDPNRLRALIAGYQQVRPCTSAEAAAWPMLLRRAALRFWLSRLVDQLLPRQSHLGKPKDPEHFQKILQHLVSEEPQKLIQ